MSAYNAQKDIRAIVEALYRRDVSRETAATALEAVVLLAERHARDDGRDLGLSEAANVVQSLAGHQDLSATRGLRHVLGDLDPETRALIAAARKVRALVRRGPDGAYRPDALTGAHPTDDRPRP